MRRYKAQWEQSSDHKPAPDNSQNPTLEQATLDVNTIQSVPPEENKVPTDGVVHFEVPVSGTFSTAR